MALAFVATPRSAPGESRPPLPGGELHALAPDGRERGTCPLEHTDVEADVVGFIGRVRVQQTFRNPLNEKIEAVYVFPLPQGAAVDHMLMTVGDRRIFGRIQPRDEAHRIYARARAAGHVASLLDQERPNVFTQSVANIEPGERVVIEIRYVETLVYEDGRFEFVFPMVVGPRYMPGTPTGKRGTGWAPDTTRVPDASRISPPVAPPDTRSGHDLSLTVNIEAGTELFDVESELHEIDVHSGGPGLATVRLRDRATIPNRDFVLRYRTATDRIGDSFLVDRDERGSTFTLVLEPPRRVRPEEARPKEMIFVIDRSGSMSGFPIEKAKETMRLAIEGMNPHDTFNLLSFAGGTGRCFEGPVPNTPQNRALALRYLSDLHGSGGTEMMPAIRAALEAPADPERVRIVSFMTDGYIGNDLEIIDAVGKNAGTSRVFAFGIGNSVNRFLLDGIADAGRGEVEYVTLESEGAKAAERFQERIQSPVLTDIGIDWGALEVTDVYPKRYPDLFSAKPLVIHGRLTGDTPSTITLSGNTARGRFERRIAVDPPRSAGNHPALTSLWARAAVEDLMRRDYAALQTGTFPEEIRAEVVALGVEFGLMTRFTSFVAVEELTVTVGGEPKTIAVPVEMPDGVSYEGVFGDAEEMRPRGVTASSPGVAANLFLRGSVEAVSRQKGKSVRDSRGKEQEPEADPDERPDLGVLRIQKLAEPLRGLAAKVARDGEEGNLVTDRLRVADHQLDVLVELADLSPKTLTALEKVGFVRSSESKTSPIVIGRIDVRRLDALAALDAVLRIAPIPD